MDRSNGMSGESFRAMIVFVRSMMTSVGTRSGGGSRESHPSSNASSRSASNRPAGLDRAPRPWKGFPPPPGSTAALFRLEGVERAREGGFDLRGITGGADQLSPLISAR